MVSGPGVELRGGALQQGCRPDRKLKVLGCLHGGVVVGGVLIPIAQTVPVLLPLVAEDVAEGLICAGHGGVPPDLVHMLRAEVVGP